MALHLVTDSTADLPPELVERWGVRVVPLYVNFRLDRGEGASPAGEIQTLKDGVDIGPDTFYRRQANSKSLPTTSQPSVQDFLDVYQELTMNGDEVISTHVSSKLSGTFNSAAQARERLGGGARVEVVDSGLASMALGLAVLSGARAAGSGAHFETVVREIREAASQLHAFFMVDTLEYLQKGGRIGKAQAFLGSLLTIKPILTLRDGEIQPLERVRTRSKALQRLAELVQGMAPIRELCVIHNTTPQDAASLKQNLSRLLPQEQIITARLGPVLGAHVGPGLVGVAVRPAT